MNSLKRDYGERAYDLCGSVCSWCGRDTEMKYLFPILLHPGGERKHQKQLQMVCFECIANQNVPKGIPTTDLPWYDPKGKKLGNEKIFISFARPAVPG